MKQFLALKYQKSQQFHIVKRITILIGLSMGILPVLSFAEELSKSEQSEISSAFVKNFPQITVKSVSESAFEGLYELVLDSGESVYANRSADHLLVNAKLLKVTAPGQVVDVTEERKSEGRSDLLHSLDTSDAVVFKGEGEKTTPIYVFTDVDCGYCRKLHEEVPALQKAGVDVVYFAWPRSGVKSNTGHKMHKVWCAKDQQSAMTAAKTGGALPDAAEGCTSPLEEQLRLGLQLGVAGTPAIFTDSGRQIGGYAKAPELLKALEQEK